MSTKRKFRKVKPFVSVNTKVSANPSLNNNIVFNRDLCEWTDINIALNLVMSYALPAMQSDNALACDDKAKQLQSLMFLQNEINETILYSLSYHIK